MFTPSCISCPTNSDTMFSATYTEREAHQIWHATDTLVPAFKGALATQLDRQINHEWDDGLVFYTSFRCCVEGCDDCGTHNDPDWTKVETQMSPKTRGMWEALKALVPLYLDSNSKV